MIKKVYQKIFSENARLHFNMNLKRFKSWILVGDNYYCPCCEHSFKRFLDKGNGIQTRKNATCPRCESLERTRVLYLYLKNQTSIFDTNCNILHFAPEMTLKTKLISNPNYYDVDINPILARYEMDITDIKFVDDTFDYIICSHVLGHIPNEKKALEEMYRVLKKDGTLFFMSLMDTLSPNTIGDDPEIQSPEQRLLAYGEKDLERLYGQDFENRIAISDVLVEKIDYRQYFDSNLQDRMSLGDGSREIIYKVTKKS